MEIRYYTLPGWANEYIQELKTLGLDYKFTQTDEKTEGISKRPLALWKVEPLG